ncbi:hypothetical protein [Inquilinus sp. CAU 1745]|uniref:hypothetical protein n=1 Tax=Inquilinus sp. CAU 1745 TaxID=3140369 RepID=UPI00325BF440
MVKTLSFYEYAGIIAPGVAFLFGLFFVSPELEAVFLQEGFTVGDLGLFLLVSYVVGHLVAALGNLLEAAYWKLHGGKPSTWVLRPGERLVSNVQVEKLDRMLGPQLDMALPPVRQMARKQWEHIFMQVTVCVRRRKADDRAEIFNAVYSLSRGVAAALLAVAATNAWLHWERWQTTLGALLLFAIALYRMHRFGVHYGRTMLREFLDLPERPGSVAKEEAEAAEQ